MEQRPVKKPPPPYEEQPEVSDKVMARLVWGGALLIVISIVWSVLA